MLVRPLLHGLLAVGLLCTVAPPAATALVITELMASNDTTLQDEDGDYEDWIEIFNDGATPVDLAGWYLTDNDTSLTKWQFPSTSLTAGQYLLVWASSKNRAVAGQPLHTSFGLSAGGEYLALVRPDGATVEHDYSPAFPEQTADISYGLTVDLSAERCFVDPTPGAENDESVACEFVDAPSFSVERGYYESPFSVTLSSATAGATVRYTTDGTDPTETHGTLYSAPIPVTTTTFIRATAFMPGLVPSASVTHTYIFLDDVIAQDGTGLPPVYYNWSGDDWEMDPEVVESPAYAATIVDDLATIPALSIVTDPEHLFGADTGIYTHTLGRGVVWERPTSAELIYPSTEGVPDPGPSHQINCGLRMQGGSSRLGTVKKHSIRLLFKSIYGPSKLDFPVFRDSKVDSFDTITFSARKSKTWHTGSARAQYIRDTWTKDTQLDMGRLAGHSQHFHLYLNGLYWGLYRATERPDGSFLAAHLGGTEDDYDARKSNQVLDGDNTAWETALSIAGSGLSSAANYELLRQYIDVENLIDYMIMNLYAENTDWDIHNWYIGRRREPGAGFMFFSWDAEGVLEKVSSNRTAISFSNQPSSIYSRLRKDNEEFRVRFGDRLHKHFFNDGALTPANAEARYARRADEINRAVIGESARWGDKDTSEPFTREDWLIERQWVKLAYFPIRSDIVLQQFRDKDLYPDVTAPVFGRHGGLFTPGVQLTLSAPTGTIYYTTNGDDPRLGGGNIASSAQAYTGPLTLTGGVQIRARAREGSSWSALDEAEFVPDTPLRITEVMYHPAGGLAHEFVELRNVGTVSVELDGLSFTDGITFTFGSGSLAPGEHALVVSDAAAFDAQYGAGLPVAGAYTGQLANGGETVRLETAAGGTIHDFTYDDAWYPSTDGDGFALVIRDEGAAPASWNEALAWRAGAIADGTPGSAELPLCSDGVDNDGDGQIDLADDGCADGDQNFENPACDDGADNDADGDVDLADDDCTAASDTTETPPPDDSFMCYKIRRNSAGPRLQPLDVSIDDPFDGETTVTLRRERTLCLPGSLNGAAVVDGAIHLQRYQLKPAAGEPRHTKRIAVELADHFGTLFIDTDKPDSVLIPATMSTGVSVAPPAPGDHDVDSYKCYRARIAKSRPNFFPKGAIARLTDELEDVKYSLKKPRLFCTSADFDGQGIKNPGGHQICYQARTSKFDPKHTRRSAIHTANALGQWLVDTSKADTLCVPARIVP